MDFANAYPHVTDLNAVAFGLKTALAAGDDVVTYTTGRAGTCEDTKNVAGTSVRQSLRRGNRSRRSGGNRLNSDALNAVTVRVATVVSVQLGAYGVSASFLIEVVDGAGSAGADIVSVNNFAIGVLNSKGVAGDCGVLNATLGSKVVVGAIDFSDVQLHASQAYGRRSRAT